MSAKVDMEAVDSDKMIALTMVGFPEYGINMEGDVYNLKTGKRLNGTVDKGYVRVKLYRNGEYKRYYVHDLMAKAFMKPEFSPFVVNHINGDKKDNRLNNLEIISQSANVKHGWKHGDRSKRKMIYVVYAPFEKKTLKAYWKKSDAMFNISDDRDKTMYSVRIE